MTKRDGCAVDKMTKMDSAENCRRKSPCRTENGHEVWENTDYVHSPSPGKSTGRQSSSGSFSNSTSDFSASSFRDSPRSAPSSLPGSRCGSTPGSRLASRSNSQESIIDLFDSMTLQFGQTLSEGAGQGIQLFSPKPRPLRHPKWSWQERVRVNHAIWRSWHMQYVKGKKPVICQFSTPTPDARLRLQADVIQGRPINKQWNPSQIGSAIRDYHKWRVFSRDVFMGEYSTRSPEDHAINLDMPHPPLSPMSAQKLMNDDTLRDFSDTLFISTEKKNFTVPAPKKITRHVYNSDIIQPGLMQLEPDFDQDFMETLDSLQDILSKTPTKHDADSMMNYSLPPSFLADAGLGPLSEAMEISDANKLTTTSNTFPVAIIANSGGSKQVVTPRSVTFAAAPVPLASSHYDPMVSGAAMPGFSTGPPPPMYYSSSAMSQGAAPRQQPQPVPGGMVPGAMGSQQLPGLHQPTGLRQVLTSSAGGTMGGTGGGGGGVSSGTHSPQRAAPLLVTSSYQTNILPNQATASTGRMQNNQGYSLVTAKMEAQSPAPTSPPACMQGVPQGIHQGGTAPTTMGIINEAIDLLSGQILSSPSKLFQDWPTTSQYGGAHTPNWAPASPGDPNPQQMKTSGQSVASFLNFSQLPSELDPMMPMDQNTVLAMGARAYPQGGELSPSHSHSQNRSQSHSQAASPAQQQSSRHPQHLGLEVPSPQPQDELMDYEHFPAAAMATGASGMMVYKQPKREYSSQNNSKSNSIANSRANSRPGSRGNSRASSRANSPRTSYAGLQPFQESLQAALQGKSDVKELGLRSPSTDRELTISVPSSCQASTASSAASSPGSQIDYPETPTSIREFEFHAPRPKRQKTPDSGTKEKESRRRIKHLHSEHKRRSHIQSGLDELQGMIPGMSNSNGDNASKMSTAAMLQKAHEYIMHLSKETTSLRNDVEKAREEIQKVNDEICECQDSLPDTGAPVNSQSERQLQQMCNEYMNQKMKDNWKFWIFSMLVRPLFTSYVAAVCTNPGEQFDEEVIDWVEESCRLKPLRKLVYSIVRQVSSRTSVLISPSKLPQEVAQIIQEEIDRPPADHS